MYVTGSVGKMSRITYRIQNPMILDGKIPRTLLYKQLQRVRHVTQTGKPACIGRALAPRCDSGHSRRFGEKTPD